MIRLALLLALTLPAFSQTRAVVTNSANFEQGRAVAPNSLATAFGDFEGVTSGSAARPFPESLHGVEVLVGENPAALVHVSSGQINFRVPSSEDLGLTDDGRPISRTVAVRLNGDVIANGPIHIRPVSPAVFIRDVSNPARPAVAVNESGSLNGPSEPAVPGSAIEIYATGAGETMTESAPDVFFSLLSAEVMSSTVSPEAPGIWRLRVRIPEEISLTGQVPFVILLGGVQSNISSVSVAE